MRAADLTRSHGRLGQLTLRLYQFTISLEHYCGRATHWGVRDDPLFLRWAKRLQLVVEPATGLCSPWRNCLQAARQVALLPLYTTVYTTTPGKILPRSAAGGDLTQFASYLRNTVQEYPPSGPTTLTDPTKPEVHAVLTMHSQQHQDPRTRRATTHAPEFSIISAIV